MAFNNHLLWTETLTRTFAQGSVILVIIGLLSLVACAIFVERFLHLKKAEIDTNTLVINLRNELEEKNIVEAVRLCDQTGGSIGAIVKAGLLKHDRGKEAIEGTMEIAGLSEIAKLEKNAKIISIIAHIAPLIGLLGTVLGFIKAFAEMRATGLMDISTTRVGEAMEYALVTTAAGLVVAIPAIVAYNYLVSRIQNIVLEMHTTSSEVIDLLATAHEI